MTASAENKWPQRILRFVGVAAMVFGVLGLAYTVSLLRRAHDPVPNAPDLPLMLCVFAPVYLFCYVTLLGCGLRFVRRNSSDRRFFAFILLVETVLFFQLLPDSLLGGDDSIRAAVGALNGGLTCQLITLFPVWAALGVWWAKRRIDEQQHGKRQPGGRPPTPMEQVALARDWVWAILQSLVVFVLILFLFGALLHAFHPGMILLAAILLTAANVVLAVRGMRKRRLKALGARPEVWVRAGLCPNCEYNITGLTTPRCPECGQGFTWPDDPSDHAPARTSPGPAPSQTTSA